MIQLQKYETISSLITKISKPGIVREILKMNNFRFRSNFQIFLDFELQCSGNKSHLNFAELYKEDLIY
jgi:hypothetical protein